MVGSCLLEWTAQMKNEVVAVQAGGSERRLRRTAHNSELLTQ
jgi:hypothetical protein